ncbi:HCL616Wp [Eremothecium sinecaudum]|uniref:Post-GPI attachment to proteins factor 3 n=1 Tax=Eremothecium sinecaudum TaxID=45286 RepID=A0A109UXX3_9SACH|nr:HCL616Wp [Eremothecium sinecaudum]AMD19535.1 HCL616Wp [Eremothecium sinecaudum]
MRTSSFYLTLCCIVGTVLASAGDRLQEFKECNEVCREKLNCDGYDGSIDIRSSRFFSYAFKDNWFIHRLLLWDCEAECDYQCQHVVTKERIENNKDVYQFHGKWPFFRFLGMQEFFSAIFSVGNVYSHLKGWRMVKRELATVAPGQKTRVLLHQYMYVAVVGMLAWTFSTIYHTRDLEITEKLDYFFAGATVLTASNAIFTRAQRLDLYPRLQKLFSSTIATIFLLHIIRLYLNWSYSYNMRFNIFFGICQFVMLTVLVIQNYRKLKSAEAHSSYINRLNLKFELVWAPFLIVCYSLVAVSCEIFDFFSYRFQIDSHAIWHGLIIFPTYYLYEFFIKDFRYIDFENKTGSKSLR